MQETDGIFFEELDSNAAEFLSELFRPGSASRLAVSPAAAVSLRNLQVSRLEANIGFLRTKQAEFNRKIDEYVQGLRALIQSLADPAQPENDPPAKGGGTQVACLGCGSLKLFSDIQVISRQESPDSSPGPIGVIVDQGGQLRKGNFRCPTCGDQHLSIREK